MTKNQALDFDYVMTKEEIEELGENIYDESTSLFPLNTFYNDIRGSKNPSFDKNKAYKDLWLIYDLFMYYKEKASLVNIIREYNMIDLGEFREDDNSYYFAHKRISEKEIKLVWKYLEDE